MLRAPVFPSLPPWYGKEVKKEEPGRKGAWLSPAVIGQVLTVPTSAFEGDLKNQSIPPAPQPGPDRTTGRHLIVHFSTGISLCVPRCAEKQKCKEM